MNLDTLWIDMEAETGTLVWRGWCPVRDIDQSDLEHIYLDLDRIRAERTDRQHEERYRALIAARDGAFEPEPEPEETTEPEAAAERRSDEHGISLDQGHFEDLVELAERYHVGLPETVPL